MMKINMSEQIKKNGIVKWALLAVLSKMDREKVIDLSELRKEADKNEDCKDIIFDIDLKINGIEVDFEYFIERWHREDDEIIEKMAMSMVDTIIDDKFNEKIDSIGEELENIRGKIKNSLRGRE